MSNTKSTKSTKKSGPGDVERIYIRQIVDAALAFEKRAQHGHRRALTRLELLAKHTSRVMATHATQELFSGPEPIESFGNGPVGVDRTPFVFLWVTSDTEAEYRKASVGAWECVMFNAALFDLTCEGQIGPNGPVGKGVMDELRRRSTSPVRLFRTTRAEAAILGGLHGNFASNAAAKAAREAAR